MRCPKEEWTLRRAARFGLVLRDCESERSRPLPPVLAGRAPSHESEPTRAVPLSGKGWRPRPLQLSQTRDLACRPSRGKEPVHDGLGHWSSSDEPSGIASGSGRRDIAQGLNPLSWFTPSRTSRRAGTSCPPQRLSTPRRARGTRHLGGPLSPCLQAPPRNAVSRLAWLPTARGLEQSTQHSALRQRVKRFCPASSERSTRKESSPRPSVDAVPLTPRRLTSLVSL